jgi:hypothetical protein
MGQLGQLARRLRRRWTRSTTPELSCCSHSPSTLPISWDRVRHVFPHSNMLVLMVNPVLGGLLADPVARYPGHLGPNSPLKDSKGVRHLIAYPYAPPNLLSAILLFLEAAIVWLGLRETLESRKYLRDRGLEVAGTIRYWFHRLRFLLCGYSSLSQEDGSGLDTGEYSPVGEMSMISSGNSSPAKPPPSRAKGKLPFRRIWTSNVLFVLLTIALFDFQMG